MTFGETTMTSTHTCPVPRNEEQRILAVRSYDILDSDPELEFDALARVASHTFSMPIAVVAMMDTNRLWFKSKIGLDVPELDRKIAFCAHTINTPDEPLIVNDLTNDTRFAENPLVSNAPHLRFYAGAPLVDSDGMALGTIAVIDAEPRPFTRSQLHTLGDFATLVMTALEGRKRAIELKRLATTDYLTGIANRAQFDMVSATEMHNYIRTGMPYSVICMDLNGFKSVNDNFGHQAGDQVLREVARRLSRQLRSGDLVARLGGDEFAVVARNCDYQIAVRVATRFSQVIEQPIQLASGHLVQVGISCGVCTSSNSLNSSEVLLHKADEALYQSKGTAT